MEAARWRLTHAKLTVHLQACERLARNANDPGVAESVSDTMPRLWLFSTMYTRRCMQHVGQMGCCG